MPTEADAGGGPEGRCPGDGCGKGFACYRTRTHDGPCGVRDMGPGTAGVSPRRVCDTSVGGVWTAVGVGAVLIGGLMGFSAQCQGTPRYGVPRIAQSVGRLQFRRMWLARPSGRGA